MSSMSIFFVINLLEKCWDEPLKLTLLSKATDAKPSPQMYWSITRSTFKSKILPRLKILLSLSSLSHYRQMIKTVRKL